MDKFIYNFIKSEIVEKRNEKKESLKIKRKKINNRGFEIPALI